MKLLGPPKVRLVLLATHRLYLPPSVQVLALGPMLKVPAPKAPLEALLMVTPLAMLKVPGPKAIVEALVTLTPPLKS